MVTSGCLRSVSSVAMSSASLSSSGTSNGSMAHGPVHSPRAGATGVSSTAGPATMAEAFAMATASRPTRSASAAVTMRDEAKPHAPLQMARTPTPKLSECSTASTTPEATCSSSRDESTMRTSA